MDAFLDFYKTGLDHILDINRKGYHLVEVYTKIIADEDSSRLMGPDL